MCKGTWVCFKCRTAARRDTWRLVTHKNPSLIGDIGTGRVRCPHCRSACQFLGLSIAIPPKRDLQGWKRLESDIVHFRLDEVERNKKDSTRKKHDIEQRVRDLKSRAQSAGRSTLVKELQKNLP
jgi:hypothetical protein